MENKKRFEKAKENLEIAERKISRFTEGKHDFETHSTSGEWCDSDICLSE